MNQEQMSGIVRHILTFAAGYAISRGWVTDDTASQIIAGAVALLGAWWSVKSNQTGKK
jgi:hypothetical protein